MTWSKKTYLVLKLDNIAFPDIQDLHADFKRELTGNSRCKYSTNLVQTYCISIRGAFLPKKTLVLGPEDVQKIACIVNGKHVVAGTTKLRQKSFLREFLNELTCGNEIQTINLVVWSNPEMAANSSLFLPMAQQATSGHFVAINIDVSSKKLKLFDTQKSTSFANSNFFDRKMIMDPCNAIFQTFNQSRSHSLFDTYICTKTPQISLECGVYACTNALILSMYTPALLESLHIIGYDHYFIAQMKKLHALTILLQNPGCQYIKIENKKP